jgi:flagellar assembly factor FliW
VKIESSRFGQLEVGDAEKIFIPKGILGFPDLLHYCLVDPNDDTLMLWLQSIEKPDICFPLLEPRLFQTNYTVRLSAADLRELNLTNVNQSAVYSIITIPQDMTQMSANFKAPLVINVMGQLAKQVVLQENDYPLKLEIFKSLKAHLITIQSAVGKQKAASIHRSLVSVKALPLSESVQVLGASL